jgi:hypothetical protein
MAASRFMQEEGLRPELALRAGARVAPVAARPAPRIARRDGGPGWVFAYLAIEIACQLALLSPELAPARVFFRSAAFGTSLLFLVLVPNVAGRVSHPARMLAGLAVLILSLSAFNPSGGALLAVVAHWSLYFAVLAPLFWVSRLRLPEGTLGRLLVALWVFHTISAGVGLLQVYFPGRFQPALTTFITEKQMLMIRLASGEWVPRPMGLTDTPGGAAASGLFAALLGIGVVLARPFRFAPAMGFLSMTMGMACLYLSQIRAALVMLGICFFVVVVILGVSGRISRAFWSVSFGVVVVIIGFNLAFDVAGDTVTSRLSSLTQSDPTTVYQNNRGFMLEDAFLNVLPKYPLGAGLGHWGMMNVYFGSPDDYIGAEIQWVGWMLDGGIPLMVVYSVALLTTIYHAVRTSLRGIGGRFGGWAAIIAAYDVGTFALCFSYAPFVGSAGLEFWLLNAVLIQVSRAELSHIAGRATPSLVPAQAAPRTP